MNKITLLLAAGLSIAMADTAFAQSVQAETNVRPAVLAYGEVLGQVVGRGSVHSRPDIATFRIMINRQGTTGAIARAAATAASADLTSKLVTAGVNRSSIRVTPGRSAQIGFVGNEAYAPDVGGDTPGLQAVLTPTATRPRRTASTLLEVDVTDMAKLAAVRTIIEEQDGTITLPPTLALRDERAARREAIAIAFAKARENADAYAAANGMRVVRVVRIYDTSTGSNQREDFAQMMSLMSGGGSDQVVTDVQVGMDAIMVR
jgi:uncharacterized protein YggE